MAEIKIKYAQALSKIADIFITHLKDKDMSLEDAYLYTLGATKSDVFTCFDKISHALPEEFFIKKPNSILREIQEELVKDFVVFMAQENIKNKEFDENFANFIYATTAEIGNKYRLFF